MDKSRSKKSKVNMSVSLDRTDSGHIHVIDSGKLNQKQSSKAIIFPTLDPNRTVHHQFDNVLNNVYQRRDFHLKKRSP